MASNIFVLDLFSKYQYIPTSKHKMGAGQSLEDHLITMKVYIFNTMRMLCIKDKY